MALHTDLELLDRQREKMTETMAEGLCQEFSAECFGNNLKARKKMRWQKKADGISKQVTMEPFVRMMFVVLERTPCSNHVSQSSDPRTTRVLQNEARIRSAPQAVRFEAILRHALRPLFAHVFLNLKRSGRQRGTSKRRRSQRRSRLRQPSKVRLNSSQSAAELQRNLRQRPRVELEPFVWI